MPIPSLAVINHDPSIDEQRLAQFVRALDTQIRVDFQPIWGRDLVVWAARPDAILAPRTWKLHLHDGYAPTEAAGALGRHATYGRDHVPEGHVYVQTCRDHLEEWTVIASHEALEMLVDEWVNLVVERKTPDGVELWPREVCDAVQGTHYEVYGVRVANFVTPEFFVDGADGPYDHLELLKAPFEIFPTGYSLVRVMRSGQTELVNRYGAAYPAWRKEVRPHSRKFVRTGALP